MYLATGNSMSAGCASPGRYGLRGVGATSEYDDVRDPVGFCSTGRLYWLLGPNCWSKSLFEWQQLNNARLVATARPPTPAELALASVSGGEAALVQKLANEQLEAQKKLNATRVVPVYQPFPDAIVYADEFISDAAKKALGWLPWLGLAVAGFAMVAVGAGSPRRYGR